MSQIKLVLLLVLFLASCGPVSSPVENRKPLVLVSIAPYKFLAERIGGEAIEVETIIPPRSNPHAFEPTSRQVLEISRGQIWFRIGEPFEEKILPLLRKSSPQLAVADLRDGIELQPAEEEHQQSCSHCSADQMDRHAWLSPKLAALQAEQIARILSDRFPEIKECVQKNLAACLVDLERLDRELETLLEPLQERSFIVSHSAFRYFCRDYKLVQLSVEQEGKEPRPRHLEEMLERAKKAHPAVALALPQHNNKGAQIIAKEMNVPVRMVDPYCADYFEMLRNLARFIADPLSEALPP